MVVELGIALESITLASGAAERLFEILETKPAVVAPAQPIALPVARGEVIDENALAAAGFSCGGVQALTVAGDPRLDTVVVQNSGLLPEGGPRIGGMGLGKEGLLALHTPVLYLDGGPTDIAARSLPSRR